MKWLGFVSCALATCLSLLLCSPPASVAAAHLDTTYGRVTGLTRTSMTLTSSNGAAHSIKLGAATQFIARNYDTAILGLRVGEYALATGGDDADTTVARSIRYDTTSFRSGQPSNRVRFTGRVVTSGPTTLTFVDRSNNQITANLIAATKYFVDGKASSRPVFTPGETAHLLTRKNPDGSYDALVVSVGTVRTVTRIVGTVSSSSADRVILARKNKASVAILLNSATNYFVNGQPVNGRPAFKTGETLRVVVAAGSNSTYTGLDVIIGSPSRYDTWTSGTVTGFVGGVPGALYFLDRGNDPVAIKLLSSTRYVVDGHQSSTQPAFIMGEKVHVLLHREPDDSLDAVVISLETSA
jgi:hypothetical protein